MASFHHHLKSGKRGTGANHATYISRSGKFSDRCDLIGSGFGNMPPWATDNPQVFWRAADKHERSNGAVYREHEIALPAELTRPQQLELVDELIDELVGDKPYQYAVHAPIASIGGVTNTHVHLMFSDRQLDGITRNPEQTFRRYNAKHPELGGARKDSGGRNRLALRDDLINLRSRCAGLQNAALAKHGHEARVDHRSLRQRGIERHPERHLGPAHIRNMSHDERAQYVTDRQAGSDASEARSN